MYLAVRPMLHLLLATWFSSNNNQPDMLSAWNRSTLWQEHKHSESLYLDFEKAFDEVNHQELVEKVGFSDFDEPCLGLLKSYLSSRFNTFVSEIASPRTFNIINGVPQGSLLGPLMFIMHIIDQTTTAISNCYVDDYKVVSDKAVMLNVDANKIWNLCSNWCSYEQKQVLQLKRNTSVFMTNNIPKTDSMKDLRQKHEQNWPALTSQIQIRHIFESLLSSQIAQQSIQKECL